jgi:hypothetical protein
MREQGTVTRTAQPVIVIRPVTAVLKYQTNNTASSQPEGMIVTTPVQPNGVFVREECDTTSVPISFIW